MPPLSVLIKPASSACNMHCDYCFYKDEAAARQQAFTGFLSLENTELLLAAALREATGSCNILFQGGEPTLAGLDYFRAVTELEKKYARPGLQLCNALQTNGYCIDEAWARFLHDEHFLVGLSIDGTPELHNLYRHTPAGGDTFARVRRTATLFEQYKVAYNILSVVTAQSAKSVEKIYNFFKKQGFRYLQFIPCLEPLQGGSGQERRQLTADAYADFLIRLCRLWVRDLAAGQYVSIRQLDNFAGMLLGHPPEACNMCGRCSLQYVVEGDGRVYPCDFYVLDGYCIGKIGETGFREMFESAVAQKFMAESATVPEECRTCRFYPLCRNGCKRERRLETDGGYGKSRYCEAYKAFFTACAPELEYAAKRLQAGLQI